MDNQITSTTHPVSEPHSLQDDLERKRELVMNDDFIEQPSGFSDTKPFEDDDILDLAGGAKDAIARHMSTLPRTEEPIMDLKTQSEQLEATLSSPEPRLNMGLEKATKAEEKDTFRARSALSSKLVDLLYWRDLQRTGVVFGASLFLLLALNACSIVSVLSYVSLALLSVTISFRIYKGILQALQKSEDGHPFKMYLDQDIAIPVESVHRYADTTLEHINAAMKELRRLFLVEDLVDSLKFAVLMWILTYVGALFNGLTLLIVVHIAAFSWPVIYERHQTQIDHYYGLVNNQIKDVMKKVHAKIPGAKPKEE